MTTTEAPPTGVGRVLLSQMIGVEKGIKQKANKRLGALETELGRAPQMTGLSRTYHPVNEADTERLPSEQVRVQVKAGDILDEAARTMADLWDVVLTREAGNAFATADITVGDVVVASNVPVTYLLFLDKQLDDVLKIVRALPVLDPSEEWTYDPATNVFRTPERETVRTKKTPFPFIKAPATDKHPAQVETVFEDKVVGIWTRIQFSGALPANRVYALVSRVEALQRAVKSARELANNTMVEQKKIGEDMFRYLLSP